MRAFASCGGDDDTSSVAPIHAFILHDLRIVGTVWSEVFKKRRYQDYNLGNKFDFEGFYVAFGSR